MEWKQFNESPKEYPEAIVEKMLKGFSPATNNLVDLSVMPKHKGLIAMNSRIDERFSFDCILFSNALEDYSFTVFEFGYDIELFPVKIYLDPSIRADLTSKFDTGVSKIITAPSEETFFLLLEGIFGSQRFNDIVSGLMKIARKNQFP